MMLTQAMDSIGCGLHDDKLDPSSDFSTLADFSAEQPEFDSLETSFMDPYYGISQSSSELAAPLLSNDYCDVKSNASSSPLSTSAPPYDTISVVYDSEDLSTYEDYDALTPIPYSECVKQVTIPSQSISSSYIDTSFQDSPSTPPHSLSTLRLCEEEETHNNGKGKITELQRSALDAIFAVTDRPSRGLVLHIASELHLHHITVKNFFSNGRRRLRRAAARLNDPERTKRENLRRKEKRKLAAIAAAAAVHGENTNQISCSQSSEITVDSPINKDTTVLSPERKALMEKLADKVHRSAAQRVRVSAMTEPPISTSYHQDGKFTQIFMETKLPQIQEEKYQPTIIEYTPTQINLDSFSHSSFVDPFTQLSIGNSIQVQNSLNDPLTQSLIENSVIESTVEDLTSPLVSENQLYTYSNGFSQDSVDSPWCTDDLNSTPILTLPVDSPISSSWSTSLLS